MSSVSIILSIPNQTARPYFVTSVELAHQTSLRSPWTMMTYSNSPHSGRQAAYSLTRSLRWQDHC